jgi:hypothetical protein
MARFKKVSIPIGTELTALLLAVYGVNPALNIGHGRVKY